MALGFRVEHAGAHQPALVRARARVDVRTSKARTDELSAVSNPPPPPPAAPPAPPAARRRRRRRAARRGQAAGRVVPARRERRGGRRRARRVLVLHVPGRWIVPSSTEPASSASTACRSRAATRSGRTPRSSSRCARRPRARRVRGRARRARRHGVPARDRAARVRHGRRDMTCPVQRVPDFLARRPSRSAPSSSTQLGVRPAWCHGLYPRALAARSPRRSRPSSSARCPVCVRRRAAPRGRDAHVIAARAARRRDARSPACARSSPRARAPATRAGSSAGVRRHARSRAPSSAPALAAGPTPPVAPGAGVLAPRRRVVRHIPRAEAERGRDAWVSSTRCRPPRGMKRGRRVSARLDRRTFRSDSLHGGSP